MEGSGIGDQTEYTPGPGTPTGKPIKTPGEGDRTFKLHSGTTSEYGRYVKYPGGAP